jgi:hypothetical protein
MLNFDIILCILYANDAIGLGQAAYFGQEATSRKLGRKPRTDLSTSGIKQLMQIRESIAPRSIRLSQ